MCRGFLTWGKDDMGEQEFKKWFYEIFCNAIGEIYMNTLNSFTNLYSGTWCAYRLPCGLCEKLKENCPIQNTVNYNGANTAGTNGTTVKENGVDNG